MNLADMNIPKEVLDAADAMQKGSFNLNVPEAAEATRKGGFTRFDELVVIESTHHEDKRGKNGEDNTVFVLKMKVLPYGDSPNVGKTKTEFLRFNFGALMGNAEAAGTGSLHGQKIMSQITTATLKKIAVAAGFTDVRDLTGEMMSALFPAVGAERGPGVITGRRFIVTFKDDGRPGRQFNGSNPQDLDAIVAAPEEI